MPFLLGFHKMQASGSKCRNSIHLTKFLIKPQTDLPSSVLLPVLRKYVINDSRMRYNTILSAFSIFNDDCDHRIVSIPAPSPSCNLYEIRVDEKSIGQALFTIATTLILRLRHRSNCQNTGAGASSRHHCNIVHGISQRHTMFLSTIWRPGTSE